MPKYTTCRDCGTSDPALLYRSGRMPRCHDCQHYDNLSRKSTGGGVEFTREQFVAWKRGSADSRACAYCGIDGERLYALGILNVRNKKPYEVIGVDRVDNARPYRIDNIVACCGPCNAIKGGILADAEMRLLGPVLRRIWSDRLASRTPR